MTSFLFSASCSLLIIGKMSKPHSAPLFNVIQAKSCKWGSGPLAHLVCFSTKGGCWGIQAVLSGEWLHLEQLCGSLGRPTHKVVPLCFPPLLSHWTLSSFRWTIFNEFSMALFLQPATFWTVSSFLVAGCSTHCQRVNSLCGLFPWILASISATRNLYNNPTCF